MISALEVWYLEPAGFGVLAMRVGVGVDGGGVAVVVVIGGTAAEDDRQKSSDEE